MDAIGRRLRAVAGELSTTAAGLRAADGGGGLFAADSDGVPGLLGAALQHRWTAALRARAAELDAVADGLAETADAVCAARDAYVETDELARRRLQRSS